MTITRRVVDIERLRALEALAQIAEMFVAKHECHTSFPRFCHYAAKFQVWLQIIADRGEPIITPDLTAEEEA